MTLKWNGVIQRKLALLDSQVMRLESHLRNVAREQFVQDWAMRMLSERAIQVCAEIMIDVASGQLGDFRRFRDEIDHALQTAG